MTQARQFLGWLPDQQPCTIEIELDADQRRLWVRLGPVARFWVAIDVDALDMLMETLILGQACAVPCHGENGRWLLNAGPYTEPGTPPLWERTESMAGKPMLLALDFIAESIAVAFDPAVVTEMVEYLRRCGLSMLP